MILKFKIVSPSSEGDYYLSPSSDFRHSPGNNPPPLCYIDGSNIDGRSAKRHGGLSPIAEPDEDEHSVKRKSKKEKKKKKDKKEKRRKSKRDDDTGEDEQDESNHPKVRLVTSGMDENEKQKDGDNKEVTEKMMTTSHQTTNV